MSFLLALRLQGKAKDIQGRSKEAEQTFEMALSLIKQLHPNMQKASRSVYAAGRFRLVS